MEFSHYDYSIYLADLLACPGLSQYAVLVLILGFDLRVYYLLSGIGDRGDADEFELRMSFKRERIATLRRSYLSSIYFYPRNNVPVC